ncbi:MAG: response regulator [Chloroflexi bacterium]|nr:response regulator [Chloroflexota bacterium]
MPHILIAEDNVLLSRLLCEVAANVLGWTYEVAGNGEKALFMAERNIPDVVLSDIDMPAMKGTELARSMKANERLARVPVVLMSSPDKRFEAIESGCADFIPKPFDLPSLIETLRKAIRQPSAVETPT